MKRILSIAFILLITNVQAQEKNKLSLEHYKNYEWTSNPKLSPDGQQILYSRSWINMVDDKRETDLWIMNKDGSTNRFFLNGSNGKWSPNGDKIAWFSDENRKNYQLFISNQDGTKIIDKIESVIKLKNLNDIEIKTKEKNSNKKIKNNNFKKKNFYKKKYFKKVKSSPSLEKKV